MACKTNRKLSDQLNDIEVDQMVRMFNRTLAPSQREVIQCEMSRDELISIIEAIDIGETSHHPFLITKFSKTPHLLTTTPSSGGELKR